MRKKRTVPLQRTLLFKQSVAMVLVLGMCMAVVGYLVISNEKILSRRTVEMLAKQEARQAAAALSGIVARRDARAISEMAPGYETTPFVSYLGVYDEGGKCLWHSLGDAAAAPAGRGVPKRYLSETIKEAGFEGRPVLEVTSPVSMGDRVVGVVKLGYSLDLMSRRIRKASSQLWTIALGVFAIGILTSYLVAAKMNRSITRLTDEVERLSEGDFAAGIEEKLPRDEVGVLVEAFNNMVGKLGDAREKIQGYNETLERRIEEARRELEAARDQLIQSEKLASIGQLAAGVAHEINNPLTNILGYAELIEEELPEDARAIEDLKTVEKEALRCKRIVENLLTFARHPAPEKRECDLARVADETIDVLSAQPAFHNVDFRRNYAGNVRAHIDPNQFRQVFTTLFVNAADAMTQGGTINVGIFQRNGTVEISVDDTGSGIPKENLSRVFDPFFTTKDEGKGTGLGLSVLHGIAERHGGRVTVESEVGRGTRFVVALPADGGKTAEIPVERPKKNLVERNENG